jgi:Ser/Thr protein kinase RdoA (MazF antagonist)
VCNDSLVTDKTAFDAMTSDEQVESLRDVVHHILSQYAFGEFEFESINHEFNSTFKVSAEDDTKYALRVNVNSDRTRANLNAEIFWVSLIETVKTPMPVKNSNGEHVTTAWHEASNRELSSVVYTWLEGEEVGDEPTLEQVFAMGAEMAKLHIDSLGLQLPAGADLPLIDEFLWGMNDLLLGEASKLSAEDQALVAAAKTEIMAALAELSAGKQVQPLHADITPITSCGTRASSRYSTSMTQPLGCRCKTSPPRSTTSTPRSRMKHSSTATGQFVRYLSSPSAR